MKLNELVNAPDEEVYHWTSAESFRKMLSRNVIKGTTVHELEKQLVGVSLSRNPLFDIQDTYAISGIKAWRIGLNLRKLKSDHRVIPIRYEAYRDIPPNKNIRLGNQQFQFKDASSDESEEFCLGDIYPMFHYISSIAVEMRHVIFDEHPQAMSRWDDEDLEGGDGTFGSAYSIEDQNLLFDIMVGTFFGEKRHKELWGSKRKSPIRIPNRVPFRVIDRELNRTFDFKDVAASYMGRHAPPIIPNNANIVPIDGLSATRGERSKRFNNKARKADK